MLLSIVFSFRNEEAIIPELIKRVKNTLIPLGIKYELIFVNDASTDSSLDLLMEQHKQDKNIKVINMSRRFGCAPCIMSGFRHAKGDAVIYMDADLQDPPELIPKMLEKWKEGADVVHTTRTKRMGEPPFKKWLTKRAYRFIAAISDIDIPKDTGEFKLWSRRAINEIIRINEYDPFMRGLARWVGFKQVHVFYEREARYKGKTHFPILGSAQPAKEFIRGIVSFSSAPLYFSLIIGFFISIGAFLYLVWIIIAKLLGIYLPGWSTIMVTMLFLGGAILFAIGILSIYVLKIYQETINRPSYIIESKVGFD